MRLRTSFFRHYSVGDLALRILGIDTIRRIFAGATVNGVIGGVFSLASLGDHADLRCLGWRRSRSSTPSSPPSCCSFSAARRCGSERIVLSRKASSPAC